MIRVLLTTTSFQDTPGPHQDLLKADLVAARQATAAVTNLILALGGEKPLPRSTPRCQSENSSEPTQPFTGGHGEH